MKYLLTLLLLCSVAHWQHYFVVPTMANPEQKVQNVSKRFYQLTRPVKGSDVTEFLFGYIKHPVNDSVALEIDTTTVIPKGNLTTTEITNFITELYGTLTTTQRNTITNYINANSMLRVSRLIITSRVKLWRKDEMEARGWFQNNVIQAP